MKWTEIEPGSTILGGFHFIFFLRPAMMIRFSPIFGLSSSSLSSSPFFFLFLGFGGGSFLGLIGMFFRGIFGTNFLGLRGRGFVDVDVDVDGDGLCDNDDFLGPILGFIDDFLPLFFTDHCFG